MRCKKSSWETLRAREKYDFSSSSTGSISVDVLILSQSSVMTHRPVGAGRYEVWYVGFHNTALGEWSIFRGPVNTNPLTHAVTFSRGVCELVHVRRCVICLGQPAVSPWAERACLFEGGWCWMGGSAGANPPVPRAMCPAPSTQHPASCTTPPPL